MKTIVHRRGAGFSSERSRRLWWFVHQLAHQQCGDGYGCDRESFPGHQIMFMLRGKGHGSYKGKPWVAGPGTAVLMDLHHRHTYYSDNADPWEMYWVIFEGPGVAEMFNQVIDAAGSPVVPFDSAEKIISDFSALFELLERRAVGDDAWVWHYLTGLMANIIAGLERIRGDTEPDEGSAPAGVAAALAMLREQHHRTISLTELAGAAHMSLFHFTRRFKQSTGFTPMEYLEKLRIGRAQELLLSQPRMNLKEIAQTVGYDDPAYFSRVFRKRAGVPPREYRKSLSGKTVWG